MHAVTPDKSRFRTLNDAVQRLLSYHVCQGSLPTEDDLRKGNLKKNQQKVSNRCVERVLDVS